MTTELTLITNHGTTASHRRHARRNEKPCDSCNQAMKDYRVRYRQANRDQILARDARYRARQRRNRDLSQKINQAISDFVFWEETIRLEVSFTSLEYRLANLTDARDKLFTLWELAAVLRAHNLR